MKKLGLVVVLAMLLSLFSPAGAVPAGPPPDVGFDGYIVKLKDTGGPRLFSAPLDGLQGVSPGAGLYKIDDPAQIEELERQGLVEYAEPNYTVSLMGAVNDPFYGDQWNLTSIGADKVWDAGLRGEGVKVAVIDSGIFMTHEDFAGVSIVEGRNFLAGSGNVRDIVGHGTFVAGLIAAAANNGKGIAGAADRVTLIPLKCFSTSTDTSLDYVIAAIYSAIDDYGADILNMSLGVAANPASLREAIDYAESKNVIVVSSVGNSYDSTLYYPAAYDTVVGVGAVDRAWERSAFSQVNKSVFVTAPGEDLVSLGLGRSDAYAYGEGTSYATPHVTALAAMAREYDPAMTPAKFRELLAASALDLGAAGYDQSYGHGIVSFENFLTGMRKDGGVPVAAEDSYSSTVLYTEGGETYEFEMSGWFLSARGESLAYSLYSSTAEGRVEIQGSSLFYTPAAPDADKSVRLVVEARDGEMKSTVNAVLNISVTSEGWSDEPIGGFRDLGGHWARKYAAFAVDEGLMNGVGDALFAPDMPLSRAMFVTILGRRSEEPLSGYTHSFRDVSPGWYADSVAWAAGSGIVTGVGTDLFGPDMNVTRQQIAVFLYRYALLRGLTDGGGRAGVYYGYTDTDGIADWAGEAMLWAVSSGIISGKSPRTLDPQGSATRAEAAAILLRFTNTFMR